MHNADRKLFTRYIISYYTTLMYLIANNNSTLYNYAIIILNSYELESVLRKWI
jgi:hypothetical protein